MVSIKEGSMKATMRMGLAILFALTIVSCVVTSPTTRRTEQPLPASIMKPNEPIAIMPFEAESAPSNLGGQVSDEVIVNLLEHSPGLKIIPATLVRNYLLNANLSSIGIPDMHTIHNLQQGLKCRYLLTGNLYTSIGEVKYTVTYTNRIANGSVTVRLVDCDFSTVVWAKHVESTYSTSAYYNSTTQQSTTYLTDGQLLQGLVKNLGYDGARSLYLNQ
jgi:TolB-like protein